MLKSYNETTKAIQECKKEMHEQQCIFGNASNNNEYKKIRKIIKENFKGQKCEKLLKILTYLNKGNTIQEIEKKNKYR